MRKVVHLVPYDGVGGVEVAARSMDAVRTDDIDFKVQYIFSDSPNRLGGRLPIAVFSLLRSAVYIARSNPNLLVVSLWRSSVVGLLVKLMRPRLRMVLMLHNVSDVHAADRFFTHLAARCSAEIWGDSTETVTRRVPTLRGKVRRVISFVIRRLDSLPVKPVQASFIFWGRIAHQKALLRAIDIFAAVRTAHPEASFTIIGPDGGDLPNLKAHVNELGLSEAVLFPGMLSLDKIVHLASHASFYLQTSLWEGMGMSVVEAMQLGLVPIVTPVGELGRYCQHGSNAVIINSNADAVNAIEQLLANDDEYQFVRRRSLDTWKDAQLYPDSMLRACIDACAGGN